MSFFLNGLRANVMSTELIMEANVSKKTLFEALDMVKEFEQTFSAYKENSLLSEINRHAGIRPVTCTPKQLELFQAALDIAKVSEGAFDPTIGVLTQGTYKFGKADAHVPTAKELQKAKSLVGYENLKVTEDAVFLLRKGMKLDLGGIGKGYIAEELFYFLQSKGATKILLNVGGEICTLGKSYRVAIANPFLPQEHIGVIVTQTQPLSISTSGDYERYIGSKEHHHILDHKSAKQNHFYSSMTIIKNGVAATILDAVATIAFNTPPKDLKILAKKHDVAIIAVEEEGELLFENFKNLHVKALELYA